MHEFADELAAMRPMLVRMAQQRLRNEAWAEDAVSETLVAALEKPSAFTQRAMLRTWLVGILKHKVVDQIRRHTRECQAASFHAEPEFGVTSNTICPGYVKTPLVDKQIADQAKAHGISPEQVVRDVMLSHQARKEFIQVEELAALAVFLASDAAASMTGTALAMDGGWTLH